MVRKHDSTANLSFFGNKRNSAVHTKFIPTNVGVNNDCGYRAIAAAMIDNILSIKTRANQELAQKLLEVHKFHFDQPEAPITSRLVTQAEKTYTQLNSLIEDPADRADFIVELGYALRQEAADEVWGPHNEDYRGAVIADDEDEPLTPAKMRLQSTKIDAEAIAALSRVFQVPIEVREVRPNRELPIRYDLDCTDASKNLVASPIVIQLKDKHYIPLVSKPDFFKNIDQQYSGTLTPKNVAVQDPDIEELLAKIAQKDQLMLEQFDNMSIRLHALVRAEDLTKEDLIDMYIKGLGTSDYLQGRPKQVTLEHGNQRFFNEIEAARNKVKPSPDAGHDAQVIGELVHAIARAVSIGQMSESLIDEIIDRREAKSSGPSI